MGYGAFTMLQAPNKAMRTKNAARINGEERAHLDNMNDMREAGRQVILRGERSGMSKITGEIAKAIRDSTGIARLTAQRYGVSMSLVYAIRKRKIWRHVV